jgi:hypothetical protein
MQPALDKDKPDLLGILTSKCTSCSNPISARFNKFATYCLQHDTIALFGIPITVVGMGLLGNVICRNWFKSEKRMGCGRPYLVEVGWVAAARRDS